MEKIELLRVKYLPKELEKGVLYVSEEFGIAGHLCPCGCENKVMTPLDSSEWSFNETDGKPSLFPSIGNWQLPCKSHYWITRGKIDWSNTWTEEEIAVGMREEHVKRIAYIDKLNKEQINKSRIRRIFNWFKELMNI